MDGKEFRVKRFLSNPGKIVITAIDHGLFTGPIAGLKSLVETCRKLLGADAILMAPGMIRHLSEQLVGPGAPRLVTRLVWNTSYCGQWGYCEGRDERLLTVRQAVSRGADIVIASLEINSVSEAADAQNAGLFSSLAQEANELGVPLIGEIYPANADDMDRDELTEMVRIGCRVVAELGADMVKTLYTGPGFADIVESTPIPVFVLGAKKTPSERDALTLAAEAAKAGARGIVFGRNIFQSCNPGGFIEAVRAVMDQGRDPDDAVERFGLEQQAGGAPCG